MAVAATAADAPPPPPGLWLEGPRCACAELVLGVAAAAAVVGAAAVRSPSECCRPFRFDGRLLETRFRFSISERRRGAWRETVRVLQSWSTFLLEFPIYNIDFTSTTHSPCPVALSST